MAMRKNSGDTIRKRGKRKLDYLAPTRLHDGRAYRNPMSLAFALLIEIIHIAAPPTDRCASRVVPGCSMLVSNATTVNIGLRRSARRA
jgi:hypothetical protein